MRYAIIENGVVRSVELLDSAEDWTPIEEATLAEAPDQVGPDWTYADGQFSPPPAPSPPRRLIEKSVVQERVNAIGKLDEVMAVLNSQPIYFARWFAPDWPNVYFDDEGLLAILAAVGCTEAEIEAITAP